MGDFENRQAFNDAFTVVQAENPGLSGNDVAKLVAAEVIRGRFPKLSLETGMQTLQFGSVVSATKPTITVFREGEK